MQSMRRLTGFNAWNEATGKEKLETIQAEFRRHVQHLDNLNNLVGERGFEPPTPWSRTRCSTRLSHSPNTIYQLRTNLLWPG